MNRLPVATAGLFAAWMVHDLEELATMSANSRALVRRLPDWVPMAASVRERGLTQRNVATGVSAVGLVVAAATVRGYRSRGRSAFYQNTLLAFGLHGLGHIGASLLAGGLHEWCCDSSDGRHPVLAVGIPGPTACRGSEPTQRSGRDRNLRRIPSRRPSRRLPRHQEPALNHGG
jgi:hypothetical protein